MDDEQYAQISAALKVSLNPAAPQVERAAAHQLYEDITNSPSCNLIGYALVTRPNAPTYDKFFGLKLIMAFIHQQWGQVSREIQIQTKNNVIALVEQCSQDEASYVKDSIAHALAEVAKRVWPQEWPSMIPDLIEKAKLGAVQVELVELVFLRIAEDAVVLQNISAPHRRQDIRQGLSLSMNELFDFFVDVLEKSWHRYQALIGTPNQVDKKESDLCLNLCITTLKTYQGYFEWASTEHIFSNHGSCINILFELMHDDNLKVLSTECLILLAQRKGQLGDRQYILGMMSVKCVSAVTKAIEQTLASASNMENSHLFMKRVGQLLSCLVTQIISAWAPSEEEANEGHIKSLKDFMAFLNLLIDFLKLEDFSLTEYAISSFKMLLQHRGLSKDEVLHSYINSLIEISSVKLMMCSSADLPLHAQYEFNGKDEIKTYLMSQKANLLQVLRGCTVALPNRTMKTVLEWVEKEIDGLQSNNWVIAEAGSLAMWEVLKSILETTIKTGVIYSEKESTLDANMVGMGAHVLQKCLACSSPDAQLSQCLLSLIGAFFPFLTHCPDSSKLVVAIVHKIATLFKETGHHTKTKTAVESQFRRHCLSSLIHICKYYPSLVSPVYESFRGEISGMFEITSHHEMIPLFESMILVSNDWKNYNKQKHLIDDIMTASMSNSMSVSDERMRSVTEFAKAIGLFSSADTLSDPDFLQFRNNVSFTVSLTLALVERSQVPDDDASQRNGGFINSEGVVMNPAGIQVMSAMPIIVTLVEHFHSLWNSDVRSVIHRDYLNSLDIRDCEKMSMISLSPVIKEADDEPKAPWQKMQIFIIIVLENCYQILGKVGNCAMDVYGNPDLFSHLIKRVFANFCCLPELRIRSFTRQFLYYFLKHCPEHLFQKVAAPIINGYCILMNDMLEKHWIAFTDKEQARLKIFENSNMEPDDVEEMKATDEILQEQLLRTVSRVYLDLLVNLCVNKNPKKFQSGNDIDSNNTADAEMQDQTQSVATAYQLTEMGKSLTSTECIECLVRTSLICLSWNDTATVFKGLQLTWPLLKFSFSLPFIDDAAAKFIFGSVLGGLQRHGQHEGCSSQFISLGCFVYVTLRPNHVSLFDMLRTIPGVDHNALNFFDSNYLKYAEKKRKVSFRKLLSCVVERHIGQKFKSPVEMSKLPPLIYLKKRIRQNGGDEIASLEDLFRPHDTF